MSAEDFDDISYDKAEWHYNGDFPKDLSAEAGGTHIGMFLAWMWMNGLESSFVSTELPQVLERLRTRRSTGCKILFDELEEKLISVFFSDEGNAFIRFYYKHRGEETSYFLNDYSDVFADVPKSLYHVKDTWANYDKLAAVIDDRFRAWKGTRAGGKR